MSRSERIRIVDHILSVFDGRHDGTVWAESRVNLILNGFDLDEIRIDITNDTDHVDLIRRRLQGSTDETLSELLKHLLPQAVTTQEVIDDSGLWTPDMTRVFLSHAAIHKEFATEVAEGLRVFGMHGFVAHDSIEPSREWQAEIERALRSVHVFVGLVHPEFVSSAWAHQEVGWAFGRAIPVFMIRLGADPPGFPGKIQWPSCTFDQPAMIAARISRWVNSLEAFSSTIGGRLIAALRDARDYVAAGKAASALNNFDALTPDQFEELDRVYLTNNQVHRGELAHQGLVPLYKRHGRKFPDRPEAD